MRRFPSYVPLASACLFGLAALFVLTGPHVQLEAAKTTRVRVLLSQDAGIYEEGAAGIRSVLNAEVRVDYLNIVRAETENTKRYFRELEKNSAMLIVVGAPAAHAAYEARPRIPIVFSMVNSPRMLRADPRNLCGVSVNIPIAEYFRVLREIAPKARRVHAFYSTPQGAYIAGEGEYRDLEHGLSFQRVQVKAGDFSARLKSLKGRADAFYMVPDPLYNRERFLMLSRFAKRNGILLMTSFSSLVREGAVFGIGVDHGKIGVLTGQMAGRILEKKSSCASEGVLAPEASSLLFFLNEKYAREAGHRVPASIVERAKRGRLLRIGVRFFNEGRLNSARAVFRSILKKDPRNKTASAYLELIIEKQTGAEIRALGQSARGHLREKRFDSARRDYRKMLKINPRLEAARRGLEETSRAQSDYQRARGESLARAGKPFQAIRMLKRSLRTLPSNQKASAYLARVRAGQSARVPGNLKRAIDFYDRRYYDRAIRILENILLVRPGHKIAVQYLRQSRKKKAAIQRLRRRLRGYPRR